MSKLIHDFKEGSLFLHFSFIEILNRGINPRYDKVRLVLQTN